MHIQIYTNITQQKLSGYLKVYYTFQAEFWSIIVGYFIRCFGEMHLLVKASIRTANLMMLSPYLLFQDLSSTVCSIACCKNKTLLPFKSMSWNMMAWIFPKVITATDMYSRVSLERWQSSYVLMLNGLSKWHTGPYPWYINVRQQFLSLRHKKITENREP